MADWSETNVFTSTFWSQREALTLQVDIRTGSTCYDNSSLQIYLSDWASAFGAVPDVLPSNYLSGTVPILWQTLGYVWFERTFLASHFWATVCKTVRRMLSDRCLSYM